MKNILFVILIVLSFSASSSITPDIIDTKTTAFVDKWLAPIILGNTKIYPQKGLFDMEGFQYELPTITDKQSWKYRMWDEKDSSVKPINNKLRVESGKAPVSKHDNEFVRLCKLDNSSNTFYEMSSSQANYLSEIFTFDPAEACLLGGDTSTYWLARYDTFYDKYGNKKGVR